MPRCATACTGSPVMTSPAKMTSPAVGFRTLVIRLNTVDLPAPFGPMTARILPASRLMSTASTATSAPKRRTSPLHSSSGIGCLLAAGRARDLRPLAEACDQDAPDALGGEHDEGDEDRSEDERPKVSDLRQLVLEEHEEHAADDRADQGAGTAHHHHDQDAARDQPE